ncbi:LRR [Musa troglodytarum]|uniref:LRR n=1 Tax=Musa troglodytarum TaxID=320322 RepID=A0A9E7L845_9LILI|nr:LRR [Musa troglodytarum]
MRICVVHYTFTSVVDKAGMNMPGGFNFVKEINRSSPESEKEPDGDGSSAVQFYAKQTSKLMLEVLKQGPKPKDGELTAVDRPVKSAEVVFDISGGTRAFIDAEEARKLLSPLTEQGNSFRKICLSNRSFGVDAARVAGPILASLKEQLTEVNLSDFIAGRPEEEALEVMKIFSSALEGSVLRYLNLSDNALGEKEIFLSYLNLEDEGAIAIANALKQSAPSLEGLDIAGNDVTPEAAPALAGCVAIKKSLRMLILSENELKDQGAVLIGKALEEGHTQLRELDLSANLIQRVGARCLAQAVSNKPDFKLLNINGNAISDEGIDEVKEILKKGRNCVDVLGPLDENDVEGEGEEDEDEGATEEGEEKEGEHSPTIPVLAETGLVPMEGQTTAMDKVGNVVLDIESLTQPSDKCSGSPKMTKALSRKGSCRMDRRNGEEQVADEATKKLAVKVFYSQTEQLKQQPIPNKSHVGLPAVANVSNLSDAGDGRTRKFNRFTAINPKKILLLFASIMFADLRFDLNISGWNFGSNS